MLESNGVLRRLLRAMSAFSTSLPTYVRSASSPPFFARALPTTGRNLTVVTTSRHATVPHSELWARALLEQ